MSSPTGSRVNFVHSGTHRACANCAAAKAKCIPRGPAGITSCERCHRLSRVCSAQPRPDGGRRRRRGKATLAQKVDEIVALLGSKSAGLGEGSGSTTPAPETPEPAPRGPPTLQSLTIEDAEAETLLTHFRQNQASFAPFVQIPDATTARLLRVENPLLFLAVMVAASHDNPPRQENFSRASIAFIADQVLVQGRKSLELLQGMLVLLNWYHTQVFLNPQISNLLHLCIALATDLGLNQPPSRLDMHSLTYGARRAIHGPAVHPEKRTLEERRAYAGCFYLTSVIATTSTVSTELPWSAQLEESCEVLRGSGSEGDLRLAIYVRLQHMVSQIIQVHKEISANGGPAAPLSVYVAPFEERLTQIWNDCPEHLRKDALIRLSHHITVMHLYKISLTDQSAKSCPTVDPAAAVALHQARQRCLHEAHTSLEIHLAIPPEHFYHHSLAPFVQVAHAMVMLARLCRPDPGAPSTSAPFSLVALLERVARHLDRVIAANHNERLIHWAAWLRKCIRLLDAVDGSDGFRSVGPEAVGGENRGARDVSAGDSFPVSTGDAGFVANEVSETTQEVDFSSMDWSTLMEDISGFGLFGFSDDDLLMQGIFSGAPGMSDEL